MHCQQERKLVAQFMEKYLAEDHARAFCQAHLARKAGKQAFAVMKA